MKGGKEQLRKKCQEGIKEVYKGTGTNEGMKKKNELGSKERCKGKEK